MKKAAFLTWAKSVARQRRLTLGKVIYSANHKTPGELRNIILNVDWCGHPAIIKLYDDPRMIHESETLRLFQKRSTSRKLTTPKLYAAAVVSASRGWIVMEKLPNRSKRFSVPLSPSERKKFLDLFVEYRTHFPTTPDRALNMVEQLPAAEFQRFRLDRWLERATIAEVHRRANRQPEVLSAKKFLPLFHRGTAIVNDVFSDRPMIWCHGHFKPQEIFIIDQKTYLTDFGHMSMFPEGYELGFIIWADYLVGAPWKTSDAKWQAGLEEWIKVAARYAKQLNYPEPLKLIRGSVIERLLGTILADVCASDKPIKEQRGRLKHLLPALKRLVK